MSAPSRTQATKHRPSNIEMIMVNVSLADFLSIIFFRVSSKDGANIFKNILMLEKNQQVSHCSR